MIGLKVRICKEKMIFPNFLNISRNSPQPTEFYLLGWRRFSFPLQRQGSGVVPARQRRAGAMEEKGEAHQLQYGVTQDEGGGPPLHQPQGKEGKEGRGGLQPGIL
jgi:hypothetical protein